MNRIRAALHSRRQVAIICATCALVVAALPVQADSDQAKEDLAFAVGTIAYVHGLPTVRMAERWEQAAAKYDDRSGLNKLFHSRELATPDNPTGPNRDTLYSQAYLDLSGGGVMFSVPDAGTRYSSVQIIDFHGRMTVLSKSGRAGGGPGDYLLAGPNWKGSPPSGRTLLRLNTDFAEILVRTLVYDDADLPKAHRVQDRYQLTLLPEYDASASRAEKAFPGRTAPTQTPLSFFETLNRLLVDHPPAASDTGLIEMLALVGIVPNQQFDPGSLDAATVRGLKRAVNNGPAIVAAARARFRQKRGPWSHPNLQPDTLEAATALRFASMGWALDSSEVVYARAEVDSDGEPLNGEHTYTLRFAADQYPPADAFWSLTVYEGSHLVENPLKRYSIGDRSSHVMKGPDGSLEMYLQTESPGPEKESNWLPTPEGVFTLSLRTYLPRPEFFDGTFVLPSIVSVD